MSARPQPMPGARSRRQFLGAFGKSSLALAVLTPAMLAACGSEGSDQPAGDDPNADTSGADRSTDTEPDESTESATSAPAATDTLRWAQAELGFVSAYVLARGNKAAIVDTGVSGSADAIGRSLTDLGLTYNDVEHVVLTHHHGDHAGSIAEVMERSVNATVYAGEADLDSITAEAITGLTGGEDIFGFEALHTPGHTAGHVAVIDHDAGLLIAGDAIFTEGGAALEGPERFFDDVALSRQSIREMAALSFNTLLVGHGPPIEGGADVAVAELAAALP